jgi:probable F420-dependent oxidoreductase
MKFGLFLPHVGPAASPESLAGTARMAEEAGFDSAWVLDRLLYPVSPRTPYPGSADGKLPDVCETVYEPLTALTWVAAQTTRLRLGTGVLVSAFRNPTMLGRITATLDRLSGGRLICGLGLGWSLDEYEASGVGFDRKGARFDDYLQVLTKVWTEDTPSHDGPYYKLAASVFNPRPVQKPHPPLFIGGHSEAALERAARFGDGWYGSPYGDPAELPALVRRIREGAARHGKTRFTVAMWAPFGFMADAVMPLVGPPDHVWKSVEMYRAAGIDMFVLGAGFVPGTNPMEDLPRFAERIHAFVG